MVTVNAYLDESSFGSLSLAATYVHASVDFSQATCGDYEYLDYYGEQASTSVDTMCHAAAEAQGYVLADYDFHMTVIPYCDQIYWGASPTSASSTARSTCTAAGRASLRTSSATTSR